MSSDERFPVMSDSEKFRAWIKKLMENRYEHLEKFTAAYLKMTNIDPANAVLIEKRDGNTTSWWFEEKEAK